jgi:anti-sigma regulatory factor (Ser/Thr protein kinase)
MASVELRFTALPAHVRTARLVAVAMARRAGVDEESLDEVRLAVGEACSRAVDLHQRSCPDEPVTVVLHDDEDRFSVTVSDRAGQSVDVPATVSDGDLDSGTLPPGVGLAVISGLVDEVSVDSGPQGGAVRMTWPAGAPARA